MQDHPDLLQANHHFSACGSEREPRWAEIGAQEPRAKIQQRRVARSCFIRGVWRGDKHQSFLATCREHQD